MGKAKALTCSGVSSGPFQGFPQGKAATRVPKGYRCGRPPPTEVLAPKGSLQSATEPLHPPNNPLPGRCNLGSEIQCRLQTDTAVCGAPVGPAGCVEVLWCTELIREKGLSAPDHSRPLSLSPQPHKDQERAPTTTSCSLTLSAPL